MAQAEQRLDTLQAIELAEGVEVSLRVAGPLLRGGALALDLLLQILILTLVGGLLSLASAFIFGYETSVGLVMLLWFFVWWWYPVLFEAGKWGATPGKKIVGLRVVQVSGSPITLGQAILRNFLRYADGMPFLIGYGVVGVIPTFGMGLATILATRRFQRLGDLAARTVVVYDRMPQEPRLPAPPALGALPPAVALLPEEIRAIGGFCDRAPQWSAARQAEIGDHAKELTGAQGATGVARLRGMARWLRERN